jgi:hypothetical protein
MGRKRKYITKEEKKEAQLKWQMEYYERNKKTIRAKAIARYRKNKMEKIKSERGRLLYGE